MKKYTQKEIEELESKADMYDEIENEIHNFFDETTDADLIDIGEWIGTFFHLM